ncbi:MAG: PEP-CTERM sorting domain-containing protein [Kiritimatiellales bacterium]|nr:PEP-CTERM sorting domain-containing protein [Kiritimatiellales bacterium]
MKSKRMLVLALCALLPIFVQAVTVECNLVGNVCGGGSGTTIGAVTRDMFYKVTLGSTEEIDYFQVGWLGGNISDITAVDSLGNLLGGTAGITGIIPSEPVTNFVAHGETTDILGYTGFALYWQAAGSISNGVYYFGYNTTETEFMTVGFLATETSVTVLNEDWAQPVGTGLGPVHVPIPEPSTIFLLLSGSAAIGFIRRKVSK